MVSPVRATAREPELICGVDLASGPDQTAVKMETTNFDRAFQTAFDEGVSDINLCVRKTHDVTAEKIKEELLKFEEAISSGHTHRVPGVD